MKVTDNIVKKRKNMLGIRTFDFGKVNIRNDAVFHKLNQNNNNNNNSVLEHQMLVGYNR